MVNKTQFFKTKVALAVVLSLGLAACGDSDGNEGSTSNTTANTVTEAVDNTLEEAKGTGSVQGTVLDTNGLPVVGATVSLAGQSMLTDASGYYHFTDVPVSGVSGSNAANAASAYLVTITAPTGYANATVTVTVNNIQLDSGNNGTNANDTQTEASAEQTTWFDGFLAQATTAILPKYAASVTGVLRDCDTGAALPAGVKLALDFTSISDTETNTGSNVGIGVPVFTTTTGANGVFTFSEIPTDSLFGLSVEGYSALSTGSAEATEAGFDDVTITTNAEGIVNNVGDQNVCLITSTDEIAPYIKSVGSTISNTTDEGFTWAVLSDGIDGTQGIVIKFNEALNTSAIDVDAVVVTSQVDFNDNSAGEALVAIDSVIVADDGMSMTVTLAAALADMTKFSVWMPRHQYEDTSANRIVTGDDTTGVNDADQTDELLADTADLATAAASNELGIFSDYINDTQFKTEYVRTRLCTYIPPVINPGTITGEQLVKKVVAADATIDAVGVFWDNGGSATISNLNGQHDQTEDLLQELWNRKNTTSTQTIVDDTAVITGDLNDATAIISDTGTATAASGKWKVVVTGATHGDEVVVTPTAAFNIIGTPITITLEDKVAPTTIIQDSYNYADSFNDDYVNAVAADAGYANGGELSEAGTSGSAGSPILYVTPRLFASDEADNDDANFNNRVDVFRSLAEGNTVDTDGDAYVTSNRNFVYDVNAIAGWAAIPANVGVAFSENIDLVAGQSVGFAVSSATPSTTLTGFVANNGLRNEDYVALDTDQDGYHTYLTHGIIQMTSNDIVGLANLDHNGVIDYTGAVADTVNGNVALSDSLVVIADAIPPLVTRAELDATTLVVTFNEAVDGSTGQIKINDPDDVSGVAASEHILQMNTATASAGNTVFTWNVADGLPSRALFSNSVATTFTGALDNPDNTSPVTFGGAAEPEVVTGTFAFAETTSGSVLNHALLTWDNVNDARGNNWAEYRAFYSDVTTVVGGSTANNSVIDSQEDNDASTNEWRLALQDIPVYLATDTIAAFEVSVRFAVKHDVNPSPVIDTEFVVTITSSHPLNLDTDQWDGENVTAFTAAELTANFAVIDTVQGAGAVCAAGTTATDTNDDGVVDASDFCTVTMGSVSGIWNGDNTELTITFTQGASVINEAAGFEFRKVTNGVSPDWADRLGHVVSTILDTNADEQSQNVQRIF